MPPPKKRMKVDTGGSPSTSKPGASTSIDAILQSCRASRIQKRRANSESESPVANRPSKPKIPSPSPAVPSDVIEIDDSDSRSSDQEDLAIKLVQKAGIFKQIAREDETVQRAEECPICGKGLAKMAATKASEHVNSCLDSARASTSSSSESRSSRVTPAPSKTSKVDMRSAAAAGRGPLHKLSSNSSPPSVLSNGLPGILRPMSPLSALPKPTVLPPPPPPAVPPNAFTAIMSGHAEAEAWKKAEASEARGRVQKRECPFYKIMDGIPWLAVDAFRYGRVNGVKAYFLSHAHSDHYTNLSGNWNNGPIYCSVTTANLIKMNLGVQERWVHPLPMNTTVEIEGVAVTMLDANHCPGSVLFLFEHTRPQSGTTSFKQPRTHRILHCGDFRASPAHVNHPLLVNKHIDVCYLDTTYLNPRYVFPAQEVVITSCAELVKKAIEGRDAEDEKIAKNSIVGWLKGDGIKQEVKEDPVVKEDPALEEAMWEESGEKKPERDDRARRDDSVSVRDGSIRESTACEDEEAGANFDISGDGDGEEAGEGDPEDRKYEREEGTAGGIAPDVKRQMVTEVARIKLEEAKPKLEDGFQPVGPKKTLVLVGTYSIGKERIVMGIARAIGSKIYCTDYKHRIFSCIDDPELHALLTRDPFDAQIHVTNLFAIKKDTLAEYLELYGRGFDRIIGLRPTGWTFQPTDADKDKLPSMAKIMRLSSRTFDWTSFNQQRDSTVQCRSYGVPYSEHSSFFELVSCPLSL